jgi:hypothetical protein
MLAPGLGLASDGSSSGCLATCGVRAPKRLLLGWPILASGIDERLDLDGGGKKAHRLDEGGRGCNSPKTGQIHEWADVTVAGQWVGYYCWRLLYIRTPDSVAY